MLEWPGDGHRLEWDNCSLFPPHAYLTSFTISSVCMSVPKKSRPVIVDSQYLVSGGIPYKVSTYETIMELLQNRVCVFTLEKFQNYPIIIYVEDHQIYEEILCRF